VINISNLCDLNVLKCDEAQFDIFMLVHVEFHCYQRKVTVEKFA